jgi:hypothetical protein
MKKTMTLIELFNKKADGEDAPEKFIYDNYTFISNDIGQYVDEDGDSILDHICLDLSNLDDVIEIISDEEEFEDITELDVALLRQCDNWLRCPTNEVTKQDIELNPYIINNIRLGFQHKINQLIKNQKKIIERINNEQKN